MKKIIILASIFFLVVLMICVSIIKINKSKYNLKNNEKDNKEKETQKIDDNNLYNVNYKLDYIKSSELFKITVENITSDLYVMYNETKLLSDENVVIIEDLKQGTEVNLIINKIDGKSKTERKLKIKVPFYNEFYLRKECTDLRNKINVCTNQFLDYKLTEEMFESSISNYGTTYN